MRPRTPARHVESSPGPWLGPAFAEKRAAVGVAVTVPGVAFNTEHPKPVAGPGVREETVGQKVNGGAAMTDLALVRARGVSSAA